MEAMKESKHLQIPANGVILLPNRELNDLRVEVTGKYFDESGSYMNHWRATSNRTPTDEEMRKLFDYDIVQVAPKYQDAESTITIPGFGCSFMIEILCFGLVVLICFLFEFLLSMAVGMP